MARLGLFALALLFVAQCSAEGLFEAGQEYQYSYYAYTLTGVRDPAPFGSSFGIKGNLIIQHNGESAIVKLSDVGLAMHNGAEELIQSAKFVKKPELSVLEKPFKVSYTSGKVSGFDADASDPEWSINVKKGLATALQIDASSGGEIGKGENTFMRVLEETVTGLCNTTYSFGAAEGKGRYALIKQRTLSECTNVPRIGLNTYGARNCEGKLQDDLLATTQAYYQFSRPNSGSLKAHIISSLGYQILQWHPPAGSPFYNLANQTMILKSSGSIAKPIDASALTKHYPSLRFALKRPIPSPEDVDLTREEDFFHPEEPRTQVVLRQKSVEVLAKLSEISQSAPLTEDSMTDPTIMGAVTLFSSLSLESLRKIYDTEIAGNADAKNFFIQLLPFCGSNPAAMMIKELIMNGKVNEMQARRMIAFLPYFIRLPTEKLLVEYEALLKDNANIKTKELRAAIGLGFGHLIGATCSSRMRPPCRPDAVSKYSRIAFEAFKGAKTHTEQMVTLLALANTRLPQAIERLIPMAKAGVVSHIVRPHIVYNLAPLGASNRNKFLSVIMPLVLNQTEGTEVRVAALATLFNAQPTFLELQQITAGMIWERNLEVRNFVLTTFKNYAQSKNPCVAPMINKLQLLLRRVAHLKTSHFRSSNRVFDYQDAKYSFGGGLQLATVYSEESRAPVVIAGRANYRVSEWSYVPVEVFIRLEGVEDSFVKMFRRLDTKDFKMDVLKDLLQKVLKVAPRQQNPMKAEIIVRSQNYNLMYRHIGEEEIGAMLQGKTGIAEMLANGLKFVSNSLMLGGQHVSWRSNDIGIPVGVGLSNPGFAKVNLAYGTANEETKIGRSLQADMDLTNQVATYLVAYNPLGVSQGIGKIRGSRIHLPLNAIVGFSPADAQAEVKLVTPTEDKPLSVMFTSKTQAFMWGKDMAKAAAFMKESCDECAPVALVTKGEAARHGRVFRDNENKIVGLESHVEVYNCEQYTGKASTMRVIYDAFKPSEINSHGSVPGFFIMGAMQLRNYFYYYPPTGTCSMKAVVHRSSEHAAEAVEIKLKRDHIPPAGKKPTPGKTYDNIRGTITMLGSVQRQWKVEVSVDAEPFNVRSNVAVKIARQPVPSLEIVSQALCVNVKTNWAALPEDIFETPSAVEPSVSRDVSFAWGEAPINECPKLGAKGVSSISVKVQGNITEEQRTAAASRDAWPYAQCDSDRTAAGRSGVASPMTQACYESVIKYATPHRYEYNIAYENLSDRGMKALHRINTGVKAALFAYWDMHAPHGAVAHAKKPSPNSGHIDLTLEFNAHDADIHMHTDVLHSHFENVEVLDDVAEAILRNARLSGSQLLAAKAGFVGLCDIAPNAVQTFDNVTIDYDLPTCWTLASADCSPAPRYAVFVKRSGKDLPLAAKIYVGGHSVELNPTDSGAVEVKANDKVVKVEAGKPFVLADKDQVIQFMTVAKVGVRYFVQSPQLKLTFRYTGDDVTAIIPATHRSQNCGLCGDYNGQYTRELVGPSGCAHKDGTDLAKAYVLKDKTCKETIATPACADGSVSAVPLPGRPALMDILSGEINNVDN